jgi:hypothetical protein
MTRRAIARKQELTPPPARLDQRSNLSPCSRHGPYAFLAKKPISRRSRHKAMPPRRKRGNGWMCKGRAFATKSPAKCRAFQFSVTSYF